jgi:hypothetical protein
MDALSVVVAWKVAVWTPEDRGDEGGQVGLA